MHKNAKLTNTRDKSYTIICVWHILILAFSFLFICIFFLLFWCCFIIICIALRNQVPKLFVVGHIFCQAQTKVTRPKDKLVYIKLIAYSLHLWKHHHVHFDHKLQTSVFQILMSMLVLGCRVNIKKPLHQTCYTSPSRREQSKTWTRNS